MRFPRKRGLFPAALCALTISASAAPATADEIKLKDGKKLYGVIVGYEDNMFRVKTDFGYVLVEKDKIATIVPSADKSEPASKKDPAAHPAKSGSDSQPADDSSAGASTGTTNGDPKTVTSSGSTKSEKASKIANTDVKPEVPANARSMNAEAPPISGSPTAPTNGLTASAAPLPPKEPEVPANREEIQGTLYINYTHGFRMYKAPSWNLIEDARKSLPNAIVAMGTNNESTLMVVGEEKTKDSLETAAATVEKRLHEVYAKYHRISEHKRLVGGLPAIEYQYTGTADDHDWSGKLAVIARGKDILTVLAMTHADSDLIQIQENVIARSIASLDFNVRQ